MSERYPGGIISKTAPTPTGPYENGTAPGIWSLEQQMQYQQQGIWPIAGNVAPYIEDVFSTYLYTGNGSTQTITNGIDLSTYGGLVWVKNRNSTQNHYLITSPDSTGYELSSNDTGAGGSLSGSSWLFTSTGFSFEAAGFPPIGTNGNTYASWTFRKQPKFFDVVTWTGNDSTRQISHSLGSAPGCIIVKCTSEITNWPVYHRSLGASADMRLNTTAAQDANSMWGNTSPTSTVFTVSGNAEVNGSGRTYVAYLFAHDAGGFGLTGTDNVISCGSYTGSGAAGNPITLGYEPQFLMVKNITTGGAGYNWQMMDTMRGMSLTSMQNLAANLSDAETSPGAIAYPTATGFAFNYGSGGWNGASQTYIYIAIRRGPMAVPTSGTSVFTPSIRTGTGTTTTVSSTSFPPDLYINGDRTYGGSNGVFDRLRGRGILQSLNTAAENATSPSTYDFVSWGMNGEVLGAPYNINMTGSGRDFVDWNFGRAPSFMDVVCYTGTGSATTQTHNLGVAPEMIIAKNRNSTYPWGTYHSALGTSKYVILNSSVAADTFALFPSVSSTTFGVSADPYNNGSGLTYVAYLFATCAGVSKVGSYTGTGTTLQVDCGFTAGARFVLIKRTDSTGDWYVWDSARGIVAGNDPYLLLNSTAAEVTGTDYVDTYSAGFEITATAPAGINANGGSYIFLAIA